MKQFVWKIAGADLQILNHSGKESQFNFLTVGIFYLLINTIIFFGFYGLFSKVFSSYIIGIVLGGTLTFLISNIYRVNMMSLDPPTLPVKRVKGSVRAAVVLRYFIISLFSIFVICLLITYYNYDKVSIEVHNEIIQKYVKHDEIIESELFFMHLQHVFRKYPVSLIFILVNLFIFLYPIYLKRKLFGNHEYFRNKYRLDKKIVEDSYSDAMDELESIHVRNYINYQTLRLDSKFGKFIPEDFSKMKFTLQDSKYEDPPFNTRLIKKDLDLNSHEEFMQLDWF